MNKYLEFFQSRKIDKISTITLDYIDLKLIINEIGKINEMINQLSHSSLNTSNFDPPFNQENTENLLDSSPKTEPSKFEVSTPKTLSISIKNEVEILFSTTTYGIHIKNLASQINSEIKKVFITYTKVERDLYIRINSQIVFKNNYKQFNILQLTTRIKELHGILSDVKSLCDFVALNNDCLRHIFSYLDEIGPLIHVSNLSLKLFRNHFEFPNSDLNYILHHKIVDESSLICYYLFKKLKKIYEKVDVAKNLKDSMSILKNQSNEPTSDTEKSLSVTREDITLMASFEEVIKKDKHGEKIATRQIKNLTNSFIRKIEKLIVKIDNNYNIRAKFINLCIFLRYGFKNKLAHMQNIGINLEDDNTSLQINTLIDEELVIKKFFSKNAINEYYKICDYKLSVSNKNNLRIVMIHHTLFYFYFGLNALYYLMDPSQSDKIKKNECALLLGLIYFGRLISKILFGFLLVNNKRYHFAILLSLLFYISGFTLSFLVPLDSSTSSNFHIFLILSRIFIGIGSANTINSKYIITYLPRALLKLYINWYNNCIFLGLACGYFLFYLVSLISFTNLNGFLFSFYQINDILCSSISVLFFFVCLFFFKDPKNKHFTMLSSDGMSSSIETLDKISVGKRKKITNKETKMIEQANDQLLQESKNSNLSDTNYIQMLICKRIKKEKQNFFGYLSNCYHALISSLLTSFFVNAFLHLTILYFIPHYYSITIFGVSYVLYFITHNFISKQLSKKIKITNRCIIIVLLLIELFIFVSLLLFFKFIYDKYPLLYAFFLFVGMISNIAIESISIKIMSVLFPQNWVSCGMNFTLFIEFLEYCVKGGVCIIVCFTIDFDEIKNYVFYACIAAIGLMVLNIIIFMIFCRELKVLAISRIIKKNYYVV